MLNLIKALLGVWVFGGLNGVFGINHLFLGLVDQLGMVFMLGSTLAAMKGQVLLSATLALLGGSCSERTPVCLFRLLFVAFNRNRFSDCCPHLIEPGPVPMPNNPTAFWWLKTPVMTVGKKANGPQSWTGR